MTNKDKYYELIIKELTDEISEEEKLILDSKISENTIDSKKYFAIKEFWNRFFPSGKPHNIIEKTEKKLGFTYRHKAKTNSGFAFKIAATILLVLSLSFSGYHLLKPKQEVELQEYFCESGKVREVVLSDGTHVWLNSMSYIVSSEPFIGKTREVRLFGEAYFEVAHNPDQPFIVKTQGIKTKVLGTHFNVSAYPGDLKHEIELYEGKVQIASENNPSVNLFLTPGKKAQYLTATGKINISSFSSESPAVWRDGVLRFYDEDLNSISKKLERKFQTKILITDSHVGDLHFTANFDVEPLDKILDLLKKAHNFSYLKTKNGIIIESSSNKKNKSTTS